jgi:hypothetical protein
VLAEQVDDSRDSLRTTMQRSQGLGIENLLSV